MTHTTSFRRHPLYVLPIAALFAAAVFALPATANPSASSLRVDLHNLDLATLAGQSEAKARLVQAARLTCERVEDEQDLSHHENYLACVDSVLAKAMPQLAQLVSRSEATQFAGNVSK